MPWKKKRSRKRKNRAERDIQQLCRFASKEVRGNLEASYHRSAHNTGLGHYGPHFPLHGHLAGGASGYHFLTVTIVFLIPNTQTGRVWLSS